jgi:L,D-peptidoglycan transpeptidase YkuD (ErfK/YbiS/YcfS/YnhG family)
MTAMTENTRTGARRTKTASVAVVVLLLGTACGGGAAHREVAAPAGTTAPTTATTRVPATPVDALPTAATTVTATTPRPPPPATTVSCPANLAAGLASTGRASQLISVAADAARTTVATVELWQRTGRCWQPAGGPWMGRIGANGFSDHHREGDETTPTGFYAIGPVVYGNAPNPGAREPYHLLVCGDWWDEDPSSSAYNTFEHVPCGDAPAFGGGSEALWTETAAYPSFAVVEYNTRPVVLGAGSAIFIHADIGTATNGCVSIPVADLDGLLRWLNPEDSPAIVMGPGAEIRRF